MFVFVLQFHPNNCRSTLDFRAESTAVMSLCPLWCPLYISCRFKVFRELWSLMTEVLTCLDCDQPRHPGYPRCKPHQQIFERIKKQNQRAAAQKKQQSEKDEGPVNEFVQAMEPIKQLIANANTEEELHQILNQVCDLLPPQVKFAVVAPTRNQLQTLHAVMVSAEQLVMGLAKSKLSRPSTMPHIQRTLQIVREGIHNVIQSL